MQFYYLTLATLLSFSVAAPLADFRHGNRKVIPTLSELAPFCKTGSGHTVKKMPAPFNALSATAIFILCEVINPESSGRKGSRSIAGAIKRHDNTGGFTTANTAQELSAFCAGIPTDYAMMFASVCDKIDSLAGSSEF